MIIVDILRKLHLLGPQLDPPDIEPLIQEGERERRRTALVLKEMERERLRQRRTQVQQYTAWEDLIGPGRPR